MTKGPVMSTYTVRGQLTGTLYGRHLSATEAAAVVLRHTTRRFVIRPVNEDYYGLWIERCRGVMEIAYSQGKPIGARALRRDAAWESRMARNPCLVRG